ncbi:hypothetical protein L0244_18865 [bacterium]|nr:hypothetical protein [bacterium]
MEKILKQALSDEDFITATTPTEQTTLDRESFEFLSIVASQSKDKIVRHQKKYGWIGASEDDHPWSVDFYTQKFHSMTSKQAKAELDAKKKKLALLQKKQKQIDSRANTETRYLCDVVKKMAHLRLESRLNWARADRAVNNILSFIASHFHVPADDIFYYSEKDILRLIDGHKLDASVLAKRKEAFAFRYDQQTFFEYSGEQEVRTLEKNENVALEEIGADSITGSVANNGYARGRVKVISAHTKDQQAASELMEEGDILVTGMTRPHLIYATKKASAIVTDEGGIACHAAIVSRELNKPCIIGTKIATKILHDGDLVEVDANKGVVKILERAGVLTTSTDTFFTPKNFSFNFSAEGIRVLFEDFLDVPFYMPSQAISFSLKNSSYSYFSNSCFEERAKKSGTKVFFEELHSRSAETLKKSREAIKAGKKIQKVKQLSLKDILQMRDALQPVTSGFAYFNNGYLDPLFQFVATLPEREHKKTEQIGKYKNDIRDAINVLLFEKAGYLHVVLDKVGKQFSIPAEDLEWYRWHELCALFEGAVPVSPTSIMNRKRAYAFLKNEDNLAFLEGLEAEKFIDGFLPKEEMEGEQQLLKGIVAHNTHRVIRGVVRRIITDYSNIGRMHAEAEQMIKGEILVSQITAPEIMLACQKASAIVTDIGGMLSHAAIVSRELNIPCIVGTKNASKILKNGDLVEVDANAGVVKIIERK